mmetsp:Transcript_28569/g.67098  ORF Transcript_28569/g.67098 Transcript_28569/m.67098 type:complete len:256 (-) Transcript_28569:124-891(-)
MMQLRRVLLLLAVVAPSSVSAFVVGSSIGSSIGSSSSCTGTGTCTSLSMTATNEAPAESSTSSSTSNDNDDNDNNNNNNDNNDDDNEEEEDGPTRCWDVSAAQLLWGRDHSESFLEKIANGSKFDTIIASDIVYSPLVIDPLWETVRVLLLLRRSATGATTGAATAYAAGSHVHDTRAEFWMAFAIRKVPVTIDFVLEKAREYGFDHELVDEQLDGHDYGDDNIEGDPETGKVYIYRFWWSESGIGGEEPSTTDR